MNKSLTIISRDNELQVVSDMSQAEIVGNLTMLLQQMHADNIIPVVESIMNEKYNSDAELHEKIIKTKDEQLAAQSKTIEKLNKRAQQAEARLDKRRKQLQGYDELRVAHGRLKAEVRMLQARLEGHI